MSPQRTPEEIRHEIETRREELAETAAALAQKADVKARARHRVEEIRSDVRGRFDGMRSTGTGQSVQSVASSAQGTVSRNPLPAAIVAAALVGFTIGWLVARRRIE